MSAKTKPRQDCLQYQAACPEKAFALPFILCTVSVRQSILTGILIVWLLLFCQVLKNILRPLISERNCRAAVSIAAGAVSFCLFRVTDYAAGLWDARQGFSFALYGILVGLLTADAVRDSQQVSGWNENRLLIRSTLLWMMMILTGIVREFLAYGSILDVKPEAFLSQSIGQSELATLFAGIWSAVFAKPAFGLVFAACAFAVLDIGKRPVREPLCSALYPVAALLILCPPVLGHGSGLVYQIAGILAVYLFHASVRYRLAYGDLPFSSLPETLMATGFFYMII